MTATKNKIQKQECTLNKAIVFLAISVPAVVIVYLFLIYSSTATAYEIEKKERSFAHYAQEVSALESSFHQKKRTVALGEVSEYGLVSIENLEYVSTSPQYYSLANNSVRQ